MQTIVLIRSSNAQGWRSKILTLALAVTHVTLRQRNGLEKVMEGLWVVFDRPIAQPHIWATESVALPIHRENSAWGCRNYEGARPPRWKFLSVTPIARILRMDSYTQPGRRRFQHRMFVWDRNFTERQRRAYQFEDKKLGSILHSLITLPSEVSSKQQATWRGQMFLPHHGKTYH